MEHPIYDEKENIFCFNGTPSGQSTAKFPCIQLLPSTANAQKKTKAKATKVQKTATTNVRAGDWVCLVCNNLNFSFRNECNRCQTQTKKQNFIQGLILMTEGSKPEQSPPKRTPLRDVTNQIGTHNHQNHPEIHISKVKSNPQVEVVQKEAPKEKENKLRVNEPQKSLEVPLPANRGFENMLLVTPPKSKAARNSAVFKEYFDSNQKVFPAYKSPQQLPSISPMLRRIISEDEDTDNGLSQFFQLKNPIFEEALPYQSRQQPRAVKQELMIAKAHTEEMPSYLNQRGVTRPFEAHAYCSTDTSPGITRSNSFHSIVETSNSPQSVTSPGSLYSGNPVMEGYQQRVSGRQDNQGDWNCQQCGNQNFMFRKTCNRCQFNRL